MPAHPVCDDREALEKTLETGEMHFRSRTRGLWRKGETSGNVLRVVSLAADCDRDAAQAQSRAEAAREHADPPPPGLVPSCAEGGVLGILCGSIASAMGTEAIKLIVGIGDPLLGRLLIYDALAMSYRTVRIRKDPAAPRITELTDYDAFCGIVAAEPAGELGPDELRALLDTDPRVVLIDVREPVEWDINHIDGAVLIPKSTIDSGEGLARLPADRIPVLYCKTGIRSAEVLPVVQAAGYPQARHLRGGISAWAAAFAPDMVMY